MRCFNLYLVCRQYHIAVGFPSTVDVPWVLLDEGTLAPSHPP